VADTGIDPVIAKRAFKYGEIDGGRFWRGRTDTSISPDRFSRRLLNVQSLDDLLEQLRIEGDAMTLPNIPSTRSIWDVVPLRFCESHRQCQFRYRDVFRDAKELHVSRD
jgi:hypothetical protein